MMGGLISISLWLFFQTATVLASPWNAEEGPLADELLKLDGNNEWISARRLAEEFLVENPESFTGHHVLGRAFWLGEGDFARASYHLNKALEIYQKDYAFLEEPPWRLESEALWSLRIITGDMGDFEGELALIDRYNEKQEVYQTLFGTGYNPMVAERGWPLMKLQRYDEAKFWAEKGLESERTWQNSLGWNVLCATAGEENNRSESMKNCGSALEHAIETDSGITIDASNAANASLGVLDFEKFEEYSRTATQHHDGSSVSAWMNLVHLYLGKAEGRNAIQAVEGALQSLASEDPDMRAQKRADVDGVFSLLLLVGGEEASAFQKINKALQYPDRRGTISTSEEQSRGSHTLIRYVARKMLAQRAAEHAATLGWWKRLLYWASSFFVDPETVVDAASLRNVLCDEERLLSTIRPFLDKGLTGVPMWMIGDLIEIVGAGVVEATVEEARILDAEFPQFESYFLAWEAEIAYQRGDETLLLEKSQMARATLPLPEQMLRARLLALEGWAYEQMGDRQGQLQSFASAMEINPSIFRHLNLPIPAQFSLATGIEGELVDALRRSPRFQEANEGFMVQVQNNTACLLGPSGEMFACSNFIGKTDEQSDQEYLSALSKNFHTMIFSISTGMTGSDWSSLDGTASNSKAETRKRLEGLLQKDTIAR